VTFGGQEFEEMARLSCSTAKKVSMKKTTKGTRDNRPYALGYSASELRRLERQGAFFRDLTEDVWKRTGLRDGMRVLDLGCGVGDTSLLAARLVGPSGVVVGVDRSAKAIDVAQRRATTGRLRYSVQFVVADLDTFAPDEPFDAIIGRLILLYLRDPTATLRRLSAYVRPGGVVAFQEMAMPLARSNPDGAHFRQCSDWILAAFAQAGVEPDMGGKLFATFLAAGLPIPQMILAGRVEGGPDSLIYDYYADIARSLLPMRKQIDAATTGTLEIDGMAERLRTEAVAHHASIMPPPLVGAWARIPTQWSVSASSLHDERRQA
jgi:2-polyprenyl-3-methyl-5-hydroxy-6-metoxy-1,4-benzoquinol methylase